MKTSIVILAVATLPTMLCAQSVVTEFDSPGTRNVSVIHYDGRFLFLARNFGDHRDFHGNTEAGLFVHSKAHDRWLRILRVSTKDAKLGKSQSDDPEENKRLMKSSVGWDFTAHTNKPWIDIPLKTSGSIAFPDTIELATGDRYKMSFFTRWEMKNATTVLYVSRKDLSEQFDKIAMP